MPHIAGMADLDLSALPPDLAARVRAMGREARFAPGETVFGPGRAPGGLVVLREGTLRVRQIGESGREIVLYRISSGDGCVMTAACLMAGGGLPAEGVAETDLSALVIPQAGLDRLLAEEPAFRDAMLRSFARRITELMGVVEAVAFGRIDIRLAGALLRLAEGGTVRATQADLATELGTAREVVSRQLAEFRRRGWVEPGRGTVRLTDAPALARLAEERG